MHLNDSNGHLCIINVIALIVHRTCRILLMVHGLLSLLPINPMHLPQCVVCTEEQYKKEEDHDEAVSDTWEDVYQGVEGLQNDGPVRQHIFSSIVGVAVLKLAVGAQARSLHACRA